MKAAPGFEWDVCPNCLGQKHRTPLCEQCGGKTTVPDPRGPTFRRKKCTGCGGKGRVRKACWRCHAYGKVQVRVRAGEL